MLSLSIEAVWSDRTLTIDAVGGPVSSISWNFNLVVLNNVLLDDGIAILQCRGLIYSLLIVISLRNEAIITWDMRRHFCCSYGEFVMLVSLRLRFFW